MKLYLITGILCLLTVVNAVQKLQERFSWTQLDFAFPSQQAKEQALAAGTYIPTNALPVGVEHWRNKLFVSVPRWRDGMLNYLIFFYFFYFYTLL